MENNNTFLSENVFDFDLNDLYKKLMNFDTSLFHLEDECSNLSKNTSRKTFPEKLYNLLQENNRPEIISWLPHGQGFKIYNRMDFERDLLSLYFGGIKFRSFQRQLNIYGFLCLDHNRNTYTHSHRLFNKNNKSTLLGIKRIPIKRKSDLRNSPSPNFR